MKKTLLRTILTVVLVLVVGLSFVACKQNEPTDNTVKTTPAKAADNKSTPAPAADNKTTPAKTADNKTTPAPAADDKTTPAKDPVAPKPGETGFLEIPINEVPVIAGPFQVSLVYFQAVDMVPEGKQPSAAEADMHLEADIALTSEAAGTYGFGDGEGDNEGIWPAYLTVNYKVMSEDGSEEITSGSMMPMNASDGPHYGINVPKGKIAVGKYKIVVEVQPSADYLLHVDSETGVPVAVSDGPASASKYYEKQTVEIPWNYTGEQLKSE